MQNKVSVFFLFLSGLLSGSVGITTATNNPYSLHDAVANKALNELRRLLTIARNTAI